MSLRCAACGSPVDESQPPTPECPECGYDGYSDRWAHTPRPRRVKPVYDDSGAADIRELARDARS